MHSEHTHLDEWADLVGEDIAEDAWDGERPGRRGAEDRWLEQSP